MAGRALVRHRGVGEGVKRVGPRQGVSTLGSARGDASHVGFGAVLHPADDGPVKTMGPRLDSRLPSLPPHRRLLVHPPTPRTPPINGPLGALKPRDTCKCVRAAVTSRLKVSQAPRARGRTHF
jgi:hypothetical protein